MATHPSIQKIERALCTKSLRDYIKALWHVVEPCDYLHNWHIDALSEHLEAVTIGQIRNLLINMPPRCAKSLIVSVFWPTWVWTHTPELRWLCSSYAQSLSTRDSLKCRRIIESEIYQTYWGDKFQLAKDQNTKTYFENDKTGYRLATSVGGATTGKGGDVILVDDPQNVTESQSETTILATIEWWDQAMSTRGNDPKTVAKVIVMQRLAQTDLSAHVLKQGGYDHLVLPMEFESDRKCITSLGWQDPRKEDGERLWPERFDENSINEYKKRLGSNGYAGQYQQRPTPRGGGMFKRQWFEVVRAAPAGNSRYVRYWDRAATEEKPGKDPDYTVGLKMSKTIEGIHYIHDIVRFRKSPHYVEQAIKNTATQDGYLCKIGLEQEPGASGKTEVAYLIKQLSGFNVRKDPPQKNKVVRATPMSAQAEAGNIKLVDGPWVEDFLKELEVFPLGDHDDQIDAASGAFNMLNEKGVNYEGGLK